MKRVFAASIALRADARSPVGFAGPCPRTVRVGAANIRATSSAAMGRLSVIAFPPAVENRSRILAKRPSGIQVLSCCHLSSVILSDAKDLLLIGRQQILRFAQDDKGAHG